MGDGLLVSGRPALFAIRPASWCLWMVRVKYALVGEATLDSNFCQRLLARHQHLLCSLQTAADLPALRADARRGFEGIAGMRGGKTRQPRQPFQADILTQRRCQADRAPRGRGLLRSSLSRSMISARARPSP